MLVGSILEKTQAEYAWELCADKLADWVRSNWQKNKDMGFGQWSEMTSEDAGALRGLQKEICDRLVCLDYILKWWGGNDAEVLAGELDVIWKVLEGDSVACYRTWIRLADRDFYCAGMDEDEKRAANRKEFRDAFAKWKELFQKQNQL